MFGVFVDFSCRFDVLVVVVAFGCLFSFGISWFWLLSFSLVFWFGCFALCYFWVLGVLLCCVVDLMFVFVLF